MRPRNTAWRRTSGWNFSVMRFSSNRLRADLPPVSRVLGASDIVKSVVVSRQACEDQRGERDPEEFLILGGDDLVVAGRRVRVGWRPCTLIAASMPREFVLRHIDRRSSRQSRATGGNYKSISKLAQQQHGTTPIYQLLDERAPITASASRSQVGTRGTKEPGRNKKRSSGPRERPQSTQRRPPPSSSD